MIHGSLDTLTLCPLFNEDVIALMRALIPLGKQEAVASAIVVKAVCRVSRIPRRSRSSR